MTTSESPRPWPLTMRVTDAEKAYIRAAASTLGLSVSKFTRNAALLAAQRASKQPIPLYTPKPRKRRTRRKHIGPTEIT